MHGLVRGSTKISLVGSAGVMQGTLTEGFCTVGLLVLTWLKWAAFDITEIFFLFNKTSYLNELFAGKDSIQLTCLC